VTRTYQAEHGGMVLVSTPTRRQRSLRTRITAIAVILAVAVSAGIVQAVLDRTTTQRTQAFQVGGD
jgi:hypothetical protein